MPANQTRRIDEIGEESRRRILDAAAELFSEKGFDRTSFVDIAERSGISRGSIPWHFKNKEGLLMAVFERAVDRSLPPGTFAPETADFRAVLDAVTDLIRRTGSAPLAYMLLTEAMSTEGSLHEPYIEFLKRRRQGLADWVAGSRAERRPRSGADLDALAAVLNGALIGLQLQWIMDPDSVSLEDGMDALAALVENGLGLPQAQTTRPKSRKAASA